MSESIPPVIEAALEEIAPGMAPDMEIVPSYRIDESSRIPVSSRNGALWDARIKAGIKARAVHLEAAEECIRYYNNNQLHHRVTGGDKAGNRFFAARRNSEVTETENIVYANTRAAMPMLYAKNPRVELTTRIDARKPWLKACEALVNTLAQGKHAPGLNLAVHMRQATLAAELGNLAWIEVTYTQRAQSSEGVQEELIALATELADAQDEKAIRETEGRIMALEEELDLFTAAGPAVKYHGMAGVVVDPEAQLPDFSDAKWMAVLEYWPTAYLNAKYREKGGDGIVRSLYMPTDVIVGDVENDDLTTFKLFDTSETAKSYGYNSNEDLRRAQRTKCWRVLDRVTRRVYLYAENKWDWPIWAEADPYGLPGFFNLVPLYFNTTPVGAHARSNVTYYLDQQDAINEIHDETRRARQSIREGILYDAALGRDVMEKWMKGGESPHLAVGVNIPDGKTLAGMLFEKPNSMLKALPLFDTSRLMASVDRVSGVSEMMRGAQLKTNTTKYAAESYNSSMGMRLDEKIDAIETCAGTVLAHCAFMCAQFMSQDAVAKVIGDAAAEAWGNHTARDLRDMFQCEAVGGSTQKNTSASKKEQAFEIARVLQPFGQYAPKTVMDVMLDVFNAAFDEVVLPDNVFERIAMETEQMQAQQGGADPGATRSDAPSPVSQGGGAPASGGASSLPSIEEIAGIIDALPPEIKQVLGSALAQGAPIMEALPEIMAMVGSAGSGTGAVQ